MKIGDRVRVVDTPNISDGETGHVVKFEIGGDRFCVVEFDGCGTSIWVLNEKCTVIESKPDDELSLFSELASELNISDRRVARRFWILSRCSA